MTVAITIGSYRQPTFLELNIKACRMAFGADVPILVSDSKSPETDTARAVADSLGCGFITSSSRHSHFGGDWQTLLDGLHFAELCETDISLKLSNRLIINRPEFRVVFEKYFMDERVCIAAPGSIPVGQIRSIEQRSYAKFPVLTDVIGIRVGSITPEELLDFYEDRYRSEGSWNNTLIESTVECLMRDRFPTGHAVVEEWGKGDIREAKYVLRKVQSSPAEYKALATVLGVRGEFDLREWIAMEGRNGYISRPLKVK